MNARDRRTQKIINLVNQAEEILRDPEFDAGDSAATAIELVITIIGIVAENGYETIGMLNIASDSFIEQYKEFMEITGKN